MASEKHDHEWYLAWTCFPTPALEGDESSFEHDQPYAVENCACGERRTRVLSAKDAEEVRKFHDIKEVTT